MRGYCEEMLANTACRCRGIAELFVYRTLEDYTSEWR